MRSFNNFPKHFLTVAILISFLLAIGCRSGEIATPAEVKTRQVTDDLDRTMTVPEKIERVVSLAPSLTEMIFAAGAGERLVGITTFCDYPAETQNIRKIGDTLTPNIESIIALQPQIVFVSTASQLESFKATMESRNIAVYVTNPADIDGVLKNLRQLGELFGTSEIADKTASALQQRVENIKATRPETTPVRVFVQISREPLFTIGKDSFVTGIVEAAGGISVTKDVGTAYPKLSKETAVALDPEVIILSASDDNAEPNPVFKNSKAVKSGRVYSISADLLSRPGPRLVDGLEQMRSDIQNLKLP